MSPESGTIHRAIRVVAVLATVAAISLSPVVPLDWATAADVPHQDDAREVGADAVATNDAFDYAQDDDEEGEDRDEEGEDDSGGEEEEEGENDGGGEDGDEENEEEKEERKEERKEEKEERKEEWKEEKEEWKEWKEERKEEWKDSGDEGSGDEDGGWLDITGTVPAPVPDPPEKPPSTPPVTVTVTPPTPTPTATATATPTATPTTAPPTTTTSGGSAPPTDDLTTAPPTTAPPTTQSTTTAPPTSTAPGDGVVDVTANKSTVEAGNPVGVVATVANSAGESRSFTLELSMFGEVVSVRDVDVPAGETRAVTFVREIEAPGEYTAVVGNESATVVVVENSSSNGSGTTDASGLDDVGTSIRAPLGTLLPLVALLAAFALAFRRS